MTLEGALGSKIVKSRAIGGGDISKASRIELADGRALFVKTSDRKREGMFEAEALGLAWLAEANALRVPAVIAFSDEPGQAFLALEMLESAPRVRDFDERLGRGLATLHRASPGTFGLARSNYIGHVPQTNVAKPTWARFYAEERVEPMWRRAGSISSRMKRGLTTLCDAMETFVGPEEPPARLHGDLWGGNLHVDERGEPCLVDPSVYGGHREMDLAMMRLFGGFSPRVFAAYHEVFPLADGAEERVPLYQLYPLLVHLVMFGSSYAGSVERALDDIGC